MKDDGAARSLTKRRRGGPAKKAGETLGREAKRLLDSLAREEGARGRTGLRDGFVVVTARRNGLTAVVANIPCPAVDEAQARWLVRWAADRENRFLELTREGAAFLRRASAPAAADPFLAQHLDLSIRAVEPGGAPVLVDESESPLAWLARRKDRNGAPFLDTAQLAAGHRFGRDVASAQLLPRVTSDWSGQVRSPDAGPRNLTPSELAVAARQRLDRAAHALGSELANLLIDVCGFQKGLELIERERSWPARSGKLVLRIALDRLAAHYGLAAQARGPDRNGRIRTWGASDYRPAIE